MKKLLLFIFLSISAIGLEIDTFASHMGYLRDFDTAKAYAKKQNKPLMILVGTDYCPWCRKFERKTLESSKIAKSIKENFVALIIDKNLDKGKYPKKYSSKMTPAVFFINPNNDETIEQTLGYVKKKDFIKYLQSALSNYGSKE